MATRILIAAALALTAVWNAFGIEPFRTALGADGEWVADGPAEPAAVSAVTTALIVQALATADRADDPMIEGAFGAPRGFLAPEGSGFTGGTAKARGADAFATALAVQALIAADGDPLSATWANAPAVRAHFQTAEGGLANRIDDDAPNLLATIRAIPALAGRPLPVAIACTDEAVPERVSCVGAVPPS